MLFPHPFCCDVHAFFMGGCVPGCVPPLGSVLPPSLARRVRETASAPIKTSSSLHLYFTTSISRCFFISLQYNRCASIRGRDEFQPALLRPRPRRRAPLPGRERQRTRSASRLLRER